MSVTTIGFRVLLFFNLYQASIWLLGKTKSCLFQVTSKPINGMTGRQNFHGPYNH